MLTGRKVLILESNAAAAFPLGSALRKAGWAVISAQDAAQAMQVARQQKPDAVVLNATLAGGGGIVALKRLRSSVLTTAIPAICIVARDTRERAELDAAGAQEMVDPPGDPASIDAALARHLGRRSTMSYEVPSAVLASPERTAALGKSGLLDTPPDEKLDELTRLAATLLAVPVALVSVVDATRQFFKSQIGLPEPWRSARQTPLTHSFCQWVVGGNEDLVVTSAREEPVLRSNLAVRDLGVEAYAGVPFRAGDGEALGSFCAVDTAPRQWTETELETLRDLSRVLESYLTDEPDPRANVTAVANGVLGATRILLRDSPRCGTEERLTLGRMIEEQGRRLVRFQVL